MLSTGPKIERGITPDSSGFTFSSELRRMAATPGYLSGMAANKMRYMYTKECANMNWTVESASVLSNLCYMGEFERVQSWVQTNPEDLDNGSDPKVGFIALLILGAEAYSSTEDAAERLRRKNLLIYLCELGCPVDHPDILGYSAFFYTVLKPPKLDLAKILLENGADVNHRTKFGSTPLIEAIRTGCFDSIQFLLDNGADLDMRDADLISGERIYRMYGGRMVAIVENWKRKRAGVHAPLEDKRCAFCQVEKTRLQACGRCRLLQYCSKNCQMAHWRDHKPACLASLNQRVVILKPNYERNFKILPPEQVPQCIGASHIEVQEPRQTELMTSGTNIILNVLFCNYYLFVYNRHQTFICSIRRDENRGRFEEVAELIRKKGVPPCIGKPGVKLYLLADLHNPEELVLKLGNILAEQPF